MNLKSNQNANVRRAVHVHYENKADHHFLVRAIRQLLPPTGSSPIIVVCIGTDRSTGDALGPLVGSYLERHRLPDSKVYGTLQKPVHAVNLHDTLQKIRASYEDPFIIGIDACLGKHQNIGNITIAEGPVLPGAGVNKELLPVGDMNITGIVNVSGFMEYSVLQNTRLNIVMNLAQTIGRCLSVALTSRRRTLLSKLLLMD
ncbi:spore protease YyaC [Sporolactobacillus terrae]|uniref:spore protease YyaC n=1 Tax=Sporolactobacillus terrae TaxID=269673 RepID=UPI001117D3AA|nr:spore protease YyaC [Sporolactobacillus terrae]